MLLLSLVPAAWALRCTNTGALPGIDAGVVPRNVRWLPLPAHGDLPRRLDPAPPGRPTRVTADASLDTFRLSGPVLPADTAFEVRMSAWDGSPLLEARFQTSASVDRARPTGGGLLGALYGEYTGLVIVTERPSDDTPLLAIVESWRADAPEDRRVSIAWTVVDAPAEDTLDFRRLEVDLGAVAFRNLAAATGPAPITLLLEEDFPRCPGPPRGFRRASWAGSAPLVLRTRWVDLAGNATPWSRPLTFAESGIQPHVWVGLDDPPGG